MCVADIFSSDARSGMRGLSCEWQPAHRCLYTSSPEGVCAARAAVKQPDTIMKRSGGMVMNPSGQYTLAAGVTSKRSLISAYAFFGQALPRVGYARAATLIGT